MNTNETEVVMYLIARSDLQMSPGKLAAQVGHGVHLALRTCPMNSPALQTWEATSHTKIVLKVDSLEALLELHRVIGAERSVIVQDEGRTEIEPTATVLGLVPMSKLEARPLVGHLKLYR